LEITNTGITPLVPLDMYVNMTHLIALVGTVLTFVGMMVIGVNALYTVSWNAGWAILGVFTSLAFIATMASVTKAILASRVPTIYAVAAPPPLAPKLEGAVEQAV